MSGMDESLLQESGFPLGGQSLRRIAVGLAVNTAFTVFELAAGFFARSMGLVGDAGHNFADSLALALALAAAYASTRPKTEKRTFGYHRLGILAAFVNSLVVIGISLLLFMGAAGRLRQPPEVKSLVVIAVSGAGFLVNGAVALFLRRGGDDLNLKGAFLHLFADALVSLSVMAGGVVMALTGWWLVDPLLTMGLACLILLTAFQVMRESVHVLMESVPVGLDYRRVLDDLSGLPGVKDVHDLHIWEIGSRMFSLSAHLVVEDAPLSAYRTRVEEAKNMLRDKYRVVHATLELESEPCHPGECHFGVEPWREPTGNGG
ncbi:MAG: cation diffusion facilitator family transporter [Candidatus Geothermincolales bacterium]